MPRILFFNFLLIFTLGSALGSNNNLNSPNGKVSVKIETEATGTLYQPYLTISYRNKRKKQIVVDKMTIGLRSNKQDFSNSLRLVSMTPIKRINDDYTMISGKKSHCTNQANERIYSFKNSANQSLNLVIRAYNDGIAFRYQLNSISEEETIIEELTSYPIAEGIKRWIQPLKIDYEGFYTPTRDGETKEEMLVNNANGNWAYPILFESAESVFTLITEANILRDHCGSHLNNSENSNIYKVTPADKALPIKGEWESPWRILIIGELADIVESTLVTDVSEPSKVSNTDWITPGPAAWIYWAHNNGSNDFQIVKRYVDLASDMKWPYNLIDWKWNEMGNGGDVNDAIQYASDKGIKTLLWYNSSTSWNGEGAPGPLFVLNNWESRKNEFCKLNKMGVSGIKVDFFNGDGYKEMNYYIDLLEDAIEPQLLINFHGATLPRGWQRTYPHLMTIEAVYGAEWYNNRPILTDRAAQHNATLPFTRNVVGPMDYTPGTFSDSQHPHITSHGHELALTVIFESALQHMPDRPESYRVLPEMVKEFLSGLPTAWDETKLLSGYPGISVVLARRKGNAWYIGGLNGRDESVTLSFTPTLLKKDIKEITLFKDDINEERAFDINKSNSYKESKSPIKVNCLPRGGFVAIIK